MNGSRSASFELYNRISERLYGPLDKFISAGRRIQDGLDPITEDSSEGEDSVEKLIAQLTYYVMDYKRLQKELSKQKLFYETIIENLQSGVLVTDKNNKIVFVNRYMEKLAGLKSNRIVGTSPFSNPELTPDLEMNFLNKEYQKALNRLTPVYYERVPIKTPSGQVFFNSGWIIPLMKDNKFDGMVCTLRDSTMTQNLSDLLRQSLDQYEDGTLIMQQDAFEDVPKAYFANDSFYSIFDISDVSPRSEVVPIPELVEILKKKMKNVSDWEKLESEAYNKMQDEIQCPIQLNSGEKYIWQSKPLLNDLKQPIGRFISVKKQNPKKKTTTIRKNK